MTDVSGMRALVTGGAGFIGSHIVDALVDAGSEVRVVDDLSSGSLSFLTSVQDRIEFLEGDIKDPEVAAAGVAGVDMVWHVAANPEVRSGETVPGAHFDDNVVATWRVLEAMRAADVKSLAFTSTSTVYGAASVVPTPETYGPLLPISVYGGAKLACEALIASFAGTFGLDALLFRFANVVGPRSNHGVTVDFVRKLRADPKRLEILGDGTQSKSYVHVADTVAGMMHAVRDAGSGVHPFNIGSTDSIPVTAVADIVADAMDLAPEYVFTGGTPDGAGWTGDVKHMGLAIDALSTLGSGWMPRYGSADAVRATAEWLLDADAGRD